MLGSNNSQHIAVEVFYWLNEKSSTEEPVHVRILRDQINRASRDDDDSDVLFHIAISVDAYQPQLELPRRASSVVDNSTDSTPVDVISRLLLLGRQTTRLCVRRSQKLHHVVQLTLTGNSKHSKTPV